jgi:hypothetical protein
VVLPVAVAPVALLADHLEGVVALVVVADEEAINFK